MGKQSGKSKKKVAKAIKGDFAELLIKTDKEEKKQEEMDDTQLFVQNTKKTDLKKKREELKADRFKKPTCLTRS